LGDSARSPTSSRGLTRESCCDAGEDRPGCRRSGADPYSADHQVRRAHGRHRLGQHRPRRRRRCPRRPTGPGDHRAHRRGSASPDAVADPRRCRRGRCRPGRVERGDGPVVDALLQGGFSVVIPTPGRGPASAPAATWSQRVAMGEQRRAHLNSCSLTAMCGATSLPRACSLRAARLPAEVGDGRGRQPSPDVLASTGPHERPWRPLDGVVLDTGLTDDRASVHQVRDR